jgi:hypothetical protein
LDITPIQDNLIKLCSEKDFLLLNMLLDAFIELIHNNKYEEMTDTFSAMKKDIGKDCKDTWFNWFIICENTIKNLINKYSAPIFSRSNIKLLEG